MKLKLLFTKKGFVKYLINIVKDMGFSLTRTKKSFMSHHTYNDILIVLTVVSFIAYVIWRDSMYITLCIVFTSLGVVNYLVKIYRFGSKDKGREYKWWEEV